MNLLKVVMLACLSVGLSGINSARVGAADYDLDTTHASLFFGVSHFGYSYTYGRFNKLQGQFSFDKENPTASQFNFKIATDSIDTNEAKRDGHLRGPDFFDVKQFPSITFVSKSVTSTDKGMDVVADITMHGQTRTVTVPMEYLGEGKGPYGAYRCGFNTQFIVKRSDFGMKAMVPKIGDEISITFSFEGLKR